MKSDSLLGEQGWCSGGSTRLPPLWPGFDPQSRRHMWVEFVAGSPLAPRGFPLSLKTNILNSNSIWKEDLHENQLRLMRLSSLNIVIYLFIYLFNHLHYFSVKKDTQPLPATHSS